MTAPLKVKARDHGLRGDALRFLGAGCLNTLITYVIYQILLFVLTPSLAYSCTWVIGILFVALFYPSKVFGRSNPSGRLKLLVAGVYAVSYLIGLATIMMLNAWYGIPRFSIIIALFLTTCFNFFVMRYVSGLKFL